MVHEKYIWHISALFVCARLPACDARNVCVCAYRTGFHIFYSFLSSLAFSWQLLQTSDANCPVRPREERCHIRNNKLNMCLPFRLNCMACRRLEKHEKIKRRYSIDLLDIQLHRFSLLSRMNYSNIVVARSTHCRRR